MFNSIDMYSFITVSGCVGLSPSALLSPGAIMLLRRPSVCVVVGLTNLASVYHYKCSSVLRKVVYSDSPVSSTKTKLKNK